MNQYIIKSISVTDEQTGEIWYGLDIRSKGGREWRCEAVTTSLQEVQGFIQALLENDIEEYHLEALLQDWVTKQYLLG